VHTAGPPAASPLEAWRRTVLPEPATPASGASGVLRPRPTAADTVRLVRPESVGKTHRTRTRAGTIALVVAVLSGLITHGFHLFRYPLYSTDEGIYLERAWSVITEGRLDPYTYIYDHAPGGWLLLAGWDFVLPHHFLTFGNPVNSGRVLMLLLHAGSTFLLFEIARKLSGGRLLAPCIATFLFNFSPLAIYYQRMVLLDNMMVFWVLLSMYLLLRRETRVFTAVWSGVAFGMAVLTKENAIFFAPTLFYLVGRRVAGPGRQFARTFWLFAASGAVSFYFLFATLKSELLPSGNDFSLSHPSDRHSSLLYELWFQVHRNQGTLLSHDSFLHTMWLPKDPFLLLGGLAAMVISLYLGFREPRRNVGFLIVGTLAFAIAFYLARGSVILDFYVIPMIPMLALCIGLVSDRVLKHPLARVAAPALAAAALLLPVGGYAVTHGQKGQLQAADVYYLPLTYLQQEQIKWVQHNIPAGDKIITDDDIWVALHAGQPHYPYAVSHWNAVGDPNVRTKMFAQNWKDIDYIVMSNGMRQAMIGNNAGGRENWILDALKNHSSEVWHDGRGNVQLQIYRIDK
jgi:4-amino-4-deoxy-L-arabinose transferase-like glycosyltransferase